MEVMRIGPRCRLGPRIAKFNRISLANLACWQITVSATRNSAASFFVCQDGKTVRRKMRVGIRSAQESARGDDDIRKR